MIGMVDEAFFEILGNVTFEELDPRLEKLLDWPTRGRRPIFMSIMQW